MIDRRQLSALNLEGITISAQIQADGTLSPVEGGFSKLLAAAKDKTLPRIHTIIVHPNQKDVPVELNDPHSELRVFKAWTLEEAIQRILVDEQTRWGEIPDFREVLYRYGEYVGREWLSHQVEAAIENAVSEQGPAYILITGKPGTGKSAFIAHQVSNQAGSVYHFIRRGEGNLDDPEIILISLTAQLRRIYALPMRIEEHQLSAADTFNRILKQVSRKLEKGQYQTIWIDGLDEAFGPLGRFSDRSLSEFIPLNGLPKGIVLILTSRPGGEHLNWLEDPERFFSISIDAQLKSSKDDIRAYLTMQNESLALGLKSEFLNQLVEASEGCFVAAVRYLHPNPHLKEVLAEWQLHPETIPKGLSGWLNWQWQWLLRAAKEQNIPERALSGVLGYLAIIDEKERAKILFHFLSGNQLDEYWDRVLQLSSELVERVQAKGSSDTRYRFFHPHFAEFIWEKVKQRIGQTADVPKDEKLIESLPQKEGKRLLPKLSFNQLRIGMGIIILFLAISSFYLIWQNRPGSTPTASPTGNQHTPNALLTPILQGPVPPALTNTLPLVMIGGCCGAYLHGNLDEIRIYTVARSSTDILADAQGATAPVQLSPTLTSGLTPPGCVPPPSGLVGWWAGEGNALDILGAHNGSSQGRVAFAPGGVGQGFSFGSTDTDGVLIDNFPELQTQTFTIDAWIKRDRLDVAGHGPGGAEALLFGYGDGGYGLGMQPDGRLFLTKVDNSETDSNKLKIMDTNWHHVAVTKEDSSVTFFVDGVGESASEYDPGFLFTSHVAIGNRGDILEPTFSPDTFFGMIDEVDFFNRALSASEIQSIFHAGSAGKCAANVKPVMSATSTQTPAPRDPIAYWKMDEVQGNVIVDSSGHGHDLMLPNGSEMPMLSTDVPTVDGGNVRSLHFDGVDDYAYAQPLLETAGSSQLTLEAWVEFDDAQALNQLIAQAADRFSGENVDQWLMGYSCCNTSLDQLTVQIFDNPAGGTAKGRYTVSTQFQSHRWYHVAFVYDGKRSTDADRLKVYVDGRLLASIASPSQTLSPSFTVLMPTASPVANERPQSTPTATGIIPTLPSAPPPLNEFTKVIFHDDFERGERPDSPIGEDWRITQDEGSNHVLLAEKVNDHPYVGVFFGQTGWQDYRLFMQVKFPNQGHPSLYVSLRVGTQAGKFSSYSLNFNLDGMLYLAKGEEGVLSAVSLRLRPDQWYALDMMVDGSRIVAAVNGTSVLDYTDTNSPLRSGNLSLFAFDSKTFNNVTLLGGATTIFLDDITVYSR